MMTTQKSAKSARLVGLGLPLLALAALTAFVGGGPNARQTARAASGAGPVSVTDVQGCVYSGQALAAHKATVFVFLSTQCPVSKVYAPRLNALAQAFGSRGVFVAGVFSNMQESRAEVAAYAKSHALTFPVVRDADASLAARFGATMTPQAVVVDGEGDVLYKGRVDDNADASLVKSHDLADALTNVVAGRSVAHPRTVAFGCVIRRPAAHVASAQITYCRDVAPILQQNCVSCHRPGEIGPMALTSYAQAAAWRADIKKYTQARQMPPWKADPACGDFQDARRLNARQIATLAKWANEGAPEGNPKDLPPMPHFPEGWGLGKPDLVMEPSRDYHLAADGADVYRCYSVPTDFAHDRYVSAVDIKPGCRAVVHHVIAYIDGTGASAALDGHDKEPGYTSFGGLGFVPTGAVGGWAPGILPHRLPPGVATLVPAGARIVLQVHYHKDGKPETDHTRMGVYFAHGPIDKTIHVIPLLHGLQIPAGDAHYTVSTTSPPSPVAVHLLAITPHMHLLGRSMRVTATLPGGKVIPLVSVSDWDFNWQNIYYYKKPIAIPQGTRITMTATYDNSIHNPRNPNNPPRRVTWGEQTTDEMCIAFLHYTLDREHSAGRVAQR